MLASTTREWELARKKLSKKGLDDEIL